MRAHTLPSRWRRFQRAWCSLKGFFKAEVDRRYGHPLGSTNGTVALWSPPSSATATAGAAPPSYSAALVLNLEGVGGRSCQSIDTLVLREDLSRGQRVGAYVIEALPCGHPRGAITDPEYTWQQLGSGSTIGAKRIFPLLYGNKAAPAQLGALRLRPTLSVAADGEVHIAEFSAHQSNWTTGLGGGGGGLAPGGDPALTCFPFAG